MGIINQKHIRNLSFASVTEAEAKEYSEYDNIVVVRDVHHASNGAYYTLPYFYDPDSTATVDHLNVLDVANTTGRLLLLDYPASNVYTENNVTYYKGKTVESHLQEIGEDFFDLTDDVALLNFEVSETIVGGVWTVTITQPDAKNLLFNLGGTRYEHTSDTMSVNATSYAGTDSNPKSVFVYVGLDGESAVLKASNSSPETVDIHHVDVKLYKTGSISTTSKKEYAGLEEIIVTYEFLSAVWHIFLEDGVRYRSGLSYTATATSLSIGSGQVRTVLRKVTTDAVSVAGGFYHIKSDGSYEEKTDFSFTNYSDGGVIGSSKYYSVVYGIVINDPTKLIALVQKEPTAEYATAAAALQDSENKKVTKPSDQLIAWSFLPVCMVIVQNDASDELQEVSGQYAFPVFGGGGGGAATSNVQNGILTDDMPVWNGSAGMYEPKTPAQVRTILDLDSIYEPKLTAGTTSQYYRGDKTWQDLFTQVRSAVLTGLNTGLTGVISATDTVLQAFGRLQNQITAIGIIGSKIQTYTPSQAQTMTTTYAAIDGSTINYTPKSSNSSIKYTFHCQYSSTESDGSSTTHVKARTDATGSYVDVTGAYRTIFCDDDIEAEKNQSLSFVIPSWGITSKNIRLEGRAYDSSDQAIFHQVQTYDGGDTPTLVNAYIEIIEFD